jgi:sugar porter (SP) family MFS transporter
MYNGDAVIPASWLSAFNVATSITGFFGGFACSFISDHYGRRAGLAGGIILAAGGVIGEVASTTRRDFLVSKLILGFGLGFYLTIGPLYCSELSPVILRGITTAGVNLGIVIGQLLSNAVIKGFGERTDRWAYRAPFAFQLFFVGKLPPFNISLNLLIQEVFLTIGLPFAPESPWYLVRQDRLDEARVTLTSLYGSEDEVNIKLAAIEQTVQEDRLAKESKWIDCFQGTNLIRTLISMGAFACQHFAGIIFVLGYSTYFFQLAGLNTSKSFDLGVGVTACGLAGNLLSWVVVNGYGRRKVFVQGMFALTGLLLLIGIMDVVPTGAAKWVQAACTVIYAFVYFLTIGAMAFVILGETSSPALRAKTVGLATATQAVFGVIMNFTIPYMVDPDEGNLKGKVGFVFGGLCLVASIGSYFYCPELKGRTFNEINIMFEARVPPRKMGEYVIDNGVHETED